MTSGEYCQYLIETAGQPDTIERRHAVFPDLKKSWIVSDNANWRLTMSRQRLLVIGADAAGMTAASQARRQNSELDITAYERGAFTSYSA
jgi:hypothetical protein